MVRLPTPSGGLRVGKGLLKCLLKGSTSLLPCFIESWKRILGKVDFLLQNSTDTVMAPIVCQFQTSLPQRRARPSLDLKLCNTTPQVGNTAPVVARRRLHLHAQGPVTGDLSPERTGPRPRGPMQHHLHPTEHV
eukprot:EG_transcript_46239